MRPTFLQSTKTTLATKSLSRTVLSELHCSAPSTFHTHVSRAAASAQKLAYGWAAALAAALARASRSPTACAKSWSESWFSAVLTFLNFFCAPCSAFAVSFFFCKACCFTALSLSIRVVNGRPASSGFGNACRLKRACWTMENQGSSETRSCMFRNQMYQQVHNVKPQGGRKLAMSTALTIPCATNKKMRQPYKHSITTTTLPHSTPSVCKQQPCFPHLASMCPGSERTLTTE